MRGDQIDLVVGLRQHDRFPGAEGRHPGPELRASEERQPSNIRIARAVSDTAKAATVRPRARRFAMCSEANHVDHPLTTTPEALPISRSEGPLAWYFYL
jgi:hypothetical protein